MYCMFILLYSFITVASIDLLFVLTFFVPRSLVSVRWPSVAFFPRFSFERLFGGMSIFKTFHQTLVTPMGSRVCVICRTHRNHDTVVTTAVGWCLCLVFICSLLGYA